MSIRELLKGIDETETESPEGWWETSKGSEFGALILNQALALEAKLEADNKALRNEPEALKGKASLAGYIDNMKEIEETANIRSEQGLRMMASFAVKTATEYTNKLEAGK